MGKNEIKLRSQGLNPLDIERYRNYPALMQRHERLRRRRALRFFTFSLLITLIVVLFLIIITFLWFRVDREESGKGTKTASVELPLKNSNAGPRP